MSNSEISAFPGLERFSGGNVHSAPFTTVAMFTPSYAALAERLRASLQAHGLCYALFEVPEVHRSISNGGSDDQSLAKFSFIRFALRRFRTPVLYLDCDVVVRQPLVRITSLRDSNREFAIFNWLADECTDCFVPFEASGLPPNRYYKFSHSVDLYAPEQLICSGAVHYWSEQPASLRLLERWADSIRRFPRSVDDKCLDYAFNNTDAGMRPAYAWLDKAYARYAWWPHVKPVIDHPQFPTPNAFLPVTPADGTERFYAANAEIRTVPLAMPRDGLIDVEQRRIFRPAPGGRQFEFVDVGPLSAELFLTA